MRVLYIDDDRVNAILFAEACRFCPGVEVQTTFSGAEALDLVQHWAPDLLVIDLHLPDTDGYTLLPALRAQLQQAHLPAYLCTADETELVQAPARAAGFDGCWTKPVATQFVVAELARLSASTAAP
jgi:two-component system, OmpR family, response regulator